MKRNAKLGDLIQIETGDQAYLVKVIYASKYFKDVMLIGVYGPTGEDPPSPSERGAPALLLYTATTCTKKQPHWKIVGNETVTDLERGLSRRVVGGEVWIEDTELAPATRADRQKLPEMGVLGYLGVENAIRDAFGVKAAEGA